MPNTPTILVVLPAKERHKAALSHAYPGASFIYDTNPDDGMLAGANAIIGNVPADKALLAPKLKWLQLNSAGADPYLIPEFKERGIALTNASGAYGLAISEYLLAGVFALLKRLNQYQALQLAQEWGDLGQVRAVEGSRTLIVGLGDIGSDFGRKMKALGSHVTGIRRSPGEKPQWLDALHDLSALDQLLPAADIVALALPNTPATAGLFNLDRLVKMQPHAILLNVGRGSAVVSEDLCAALNAGTIFGAYLDVTDPEPLPKGHPLWTAKNVIITPHISGQYHLQETFERIIAIACENLSRFAKGEPLLNTVSFSTGYHEAAGRMAGKDA